MKGSQTTRVEISDCRDQFLCCEKATKLSSFKTSLLTFRLWDRKGLNLHLILTTPHYLVALFLLGICRRTPSASHHNKRRENISHRGWSVTAAPTHIDSRWSINEKRMAIMHFPLCVCSRKSTKDSNHKRINDESPETWEERFQTRSVKLWFVLGFGTKPTLFCMICGENCRK